MPCISRRARITYLRGQSVTQPAVHCTALIIGRFLTHRALCGTARTEGPTCTAMKLWADWPHGQPRCVRHAHYTQSADTDIRRPTCCSYALSVLCLISCLWGSFCNYKLQNATRPIKNMKHLKYTFWLLCGVICAILCLAV